MRIYTFFGEVINNIGYIKSLSEIAHAKVLRLTVGSKVRLIADKEYFGLIESFTKSLIIIKIEEIYDDKYSLKKVIDCYLGIIKPKAFSEAVKHLSEIGVNSITPVITKYSSQLTVIDKYQAIANESAKQSLAIKVTQLNPKVKLEEIDFTKYDLAIFGKERSGDVNIEKIYDKIELADRICFVVGPEGGFAENELFFLEKHTLGFSLGNRIYRSETAAIVIAGMIALRGEK